MRFSARGTYWDIWNINYPKDKTKMPNEVCSKCHEDFMNCKCEQFHPNVILPERKDNEQSLEMRWIPGQPGIKVYIWEGKRIVQTSFHPTTQIVDALISAYENYGEQYKK